MTHDIMVSAPFFRLLLWSLRNNLRWQRLQKRPLEHKFALLQSNFTALISSRYSRHILAKFSGVEFQGLLKFKKEKKKKVVLRSRPSQNMTFGLFHVVVLQRRQRNVQKNRDAGAELLCY